MISGFLRRKLYGVSGAQKVDVCLLREFAPPHGPMMALFEYEQSICDEPLTVCGTGRSQADGGPCFKRHAEREIPVSALRPPTKLTLLGPVPDDFELTSPDRRGVERRQVAP